MGEVTTFLRGHFNDASDLLVPFINQINRSRLHVVLTGEDFRRTSAKFRHVDRPFHRREANFILHPQSVLADRIRIFRRVVRSSDPQVTKDVRRLIIRAWHAICPERVTRACCRLMVRMDTRGTNRTSVIIASEFVSHLIHAILGGMISITRVTPQPPTTRLNQMDPFTSGIIRTNRHSVVTRNVLPRAIASKERRVVREVKVYFRPFLHPRSYIFIRQDLQYLIR